MIEKNKGISIVILTLSAIVFMIIGIFVYKEFFVG
jgi:uncharacterized protein YneF (UPF0154 family)